MRLDNFGCDTDQEQSEKIEREKEKDQEKEIEKLNEELLDMQREESWLDDMIYTVNNQLQEMSQDELYEQFAYVTYDDIKKLNNITEYKDSTLLAIRAPPGTKLEVPDEDEPSTVQQEEVKEKRPSSETQNKQLPDTAAANKDPKERGIQTNDKKRYQIMLNSAGEEIMVYLITSNDEKSEDDAQEDSEQDDDPDPEPECEDEKDSFLNFDNQL